jgi:hypothetical protein
MEGPMIRHDDDDDDDGPFDRRGLLKDGRSTRVPMLMRDSDTLSEVQRSVITDGLQRDAARRLGLADGLDLHRPGPRFCTDESALDAKTQAYLEDVKETQEAWRRKPSGSVTEFVGARPGDVCTINGQLGHLNHRLECVPDRSDKQDSMPRMMTADEAQRMRDEAWAADREATEAAWRRAR